MCCWGSDSLIRPPPPHLHISLCPPPLPTSAFPSVCQLLSPSPPLPPPHPLHSLSPPRPPPLPPVTILRDYSSPSPSPALPTYPHVSLSPPDSGKRLYLVAARTGLWVALPLAESGLTLSRRRIRREESNEVFFEKPGRRLSMIPGPAGRGWREGLAGVRKRRQAGSG